MAADPLDAGTLDLFRAGRILALRREIGPPPVWVRQMIALPREACGVPVSRLNTRWGVAEIVPGRGAADGGTRELAVPSGGESRLALLYLMTEALRSPQGRVHAAGFASFLRRIGHSINRLSETNRQCLHELATATWHFLAPGGGQLTRVTCADRVGYAPPGGERGVLRPVEYVLSPSWVTSLTPLTVDWATVGNLAERPLALDAYVWLSHVLTVLPDGGLPVTWDDLATDLAVGGPPSRARRQAASALRLALRRYPEARVTEQEAGLVLHPSPPPLTCPRRTA